MLAQATRRVRRLKGSMFLTHGSDSFNKRGLTKARRLLDNALIREQLEEGPEPVFAYVATIFRIVLSTQVYENYGAHDWNGKGKCPQYWKAKGGNDYMRNVGTAMDVLTLGHDGIKAIVADMQAKCCVSDHGWHEYMLDWELLPDGMLTWHEKMYKEELEMGWIGPDQYKQAIARMYI